MPQSVVSCIEASKSRTKPISLPTLPIHRLWLGNILAVTGAEEHGAAKSDLSALISTPFHCEPFQVSHTLHARATAHGQAERCIRAQSFSPAALLALSTSLFLACLHLHTVDLQCSFTAQDSERRGLYDDDLCTPAWSNILPALCRSLQVLIYR